MKKNCKLLALIIAVSLFTFQAVSYAQDMEAKPTTNVTDVVKTEKATDPTPVKPVDIKKTEATQPIKEVNTVSKQPAKSGWDTADKWIERIKNLVLALLSVIGVILSWTLGNGWRKNKRLVKILEYADKAFPIVESIAKKTDWKGDDKIVEMLRRISDWLKAEGDQNLSAHEIAILKKDAADKAIAIKPDNAQVDGKVVSRA